MRWRGPRVGSLADDLVSERLEHRIRHPRANAASYATSTVQREPAPPAGLDGEFAEVLPKGFRGRRSSSHLGGVQGRQDAQVNVRCAGKRFVAALPEPAMYQSQLHASLVDALGGTIWTRSTRDEDNFRQVFCSSIYRHVSPSNVEIPSTRSANGDIIIFGRRIELKYASAEKREGMSEFLQDFELLLAGKIDFAALAIRADRDDRHVHSCVHMPKLPKTGGAANFADRAFDSKSYKQAAVFLSATFPHAPESIVVRAGKGNVATSYLSFERAPAIARSSFLETHWGLIHTDVVGSQEDGLICFLFKRADDVTLDTVSKSGSVSLAIPYSPNPIPLAQCRRVNAVCKTRKTVAGAAVWERTVEVDIPAFNIV